MQSAFDAVVIGAGGLGSSVTYHLARQGVKVAVCDAGEPAGQTTARAAGMAMQIQADEVLTQVSTQSIEMLLRFEEDTGERLSLYKNGSIKIARRTEDVEQLNNEIDRGRSAGVAVERIAPAEAMRLHPFLSVEQVADMWYSPNDLYFDATDLPRAYLSAARAQGATVLTRTRVDGVTREADRVVGVQTSAGPLSTPVVVNAAGAWAPVVAARMGTRLPVVATQHQRCVTPPISGAVDSLPAVRVIDAKFNMRPDHGRFLVGGFINTPRQFRHDEVEPDLDLDMLAYDEAALRQKMRSVADVLPILDREPIDRVLGGLITMTPDGHFIAGDMPGVSGAYVLCGCNSGGLSTSPVLGSGLADWITTGRRPAIVEPFSLDRFPSDLAWDEDRLLEACFATYVGKYSEAETVHGTVR